VLSGELKAGTGGTVRIVVTGAAGQLGHDLLDVLHGTLPVGGSPALVDAVAPLASAGRVDTVGTDLPDLDLSDRSAVLAFIGQVRPHVVVHGAAWTAVDACEEDPDRAWAVNALATRHVAEACRQVGAHLVYVSTDYVFDGRQAAPYTEWDLPAPVSVYGRSKRGGELEAGPGATVVRTAWVSGAHGANMVKTVLRLAAGPGSLRFVDDQRGSPTFTADLAVALARLAVERRPGCFHQTNAGQTTWYHFARTVLEVAGHDADRVCPITTVALDPPRPAPRPANSVLDNAAWRLSGLPPLPPWQDALSRLVAALQRSPELLDARPAVPLPVDRTAG